MAWAGLAWTLVLGVVTPPELLTFVEAPYPQAEALAGVGGSVALVLTVDAEGYVSGADVKESAGTALDRAAMGAALQFVFKPAQRDGVPVAARILYTYVFAPPITPAAAPVDSNLLLPQEEVPIDVTVTGKSAAQRLRESAQAVVVIETLEAKQQSADLGEVLARTSQVSVQRQGGLGSPMRLSLAGFGDGQVRYFLDGVPLALAGFPYGVGNVPVNLVDRVEIYRGVVPVRFGADALGGALNLVSEGQLEGYGAAASYQVGSFGTHRVTLGGHARHAPTGLFARGAFFFDHATNNYFIDVQAPNARGKLAPVHVPRFHDVYGAVGGRVEAGVTGLGWAKRLLVRGFVTHFSRDIQTNALMTLPYGEPWTDETNYGAALDYAGVWGNLSVDAVAGFGHDTLRFVDVSNCVYDWFGKCVSRRLVRGEIEDVPHDDIYWQPNAYGRFNATYRWGEDQTLAVAVAPTWNLRTGDRRRESPADTYDPLHGKLEITKTVLGLEHTLRAWGAALENQLFVKEYLQWARADQVVSANVTRHHHQDIQHTGAGDGLRLWLGEGLYAKASYEWATRLPDPEEMFGDGTLTLPAIMLLPEVSHNTNLAVTLDAWKTPVGMLRGALHLFWREASQLIVLLPNATFSRYVNVTSARALGADAAAGWTSVGDYISLDASVNYQDFRNASNSGEFSPYRGDRIPDIPYLFANGAVRVSFRNLFVSSDRGMLQWTTRFVEGFFRGWESAGLRQYKQTVDAQLIHSAALTYVWKHPLAVVSLALEVQNLTDARAYDFYGAQRPGRAFYFKTTVQL